MIPVDSDGVANVVPKQIFTDDDDSSKTVSNVDFFVMHCTLYDLSWTGIAPISIILFRHVTNHLELALVYIQDYMVTFYTCHCTWSNV